jgi:hypothetical protein
VISAESIVAASTQQVATDLGDEVVVLSLTNGTYYGLDAVGARVWSLLGERRAVASIRDAVLAEYDGVEPERCLSDVIEFLQQLAEWGLVDVDNTHARNGR